MSFSITAIATSGMQAAAAQFAVSADNIAHLNTPDHQRKVAETAPLAAGGVQATVLTGETGVNAEEELLSLIGAKIAFEANASVFETGAELWDVLATIKRD